jgi:hypothetical protein
MLYNYLEQHVEWERAFNRDRVGDIRFGKVSYIGERAVEVVRLEDGMGLIRVDIPSLAFAARFINSGDQVLVLYPDESIDVCDVASGRIVQTFRSRGWVVPTFVALMTGFSVWCCLWVKQSVQHAVSPQWDLLIFSGLILSGLMLRVFLVGSVRDPNRLIYQFLEALGVSWLIMLSLWFIFGKTRWSVKVIGPLLGLVGVLLIAMIVFRGPKQPLWEFLVGVLGITATVIVTFGVARMLCWCLVSTLEGHQQSDRKLESRVPLRDLFLVFVVAGIFFAVLRFIPVGVYDRKSIEMLALLLVVVAISAVGGVWPALSPRHWLLRAIVFVMLINLAAAVYAIFYPGFRALPEWLNQLRFAGSVSGFTCALLLVFRVRGWRLTRSRHAPP